MTEFQGKVILITGATSGIGYATAMHFAELGAVVVGTARHETELEAELVAAGADRAKLMLGDMTSETTVKKIIDTTVTTYGQLNFAFNNAGIFLHEAPLHDHETETWDQVMASNLNSIYYCMKQEIRAMQTNTSGVIVNNASVVGHRGSQASGIAYTTAKHGVIGMTRQAAITYADSGIRINAVSPGPTLTPATSAGLDLPEDEAKARISSLNPSGELASLDTIAATVAFLCTDAARSINGHDVPVDGGQLAKL